MYEYRCTRNALYQHNCTGRDDTRERQGYYIHADSDEHAWELMATRFPNETEYGFTVQKWQSFDVVIREIKKDEK